MALERLVHDGRRNAVIGWTLTGIVGLGAIESITANAPLWGGFELVIAGVAAAPALAARDWTAIVDWPLLAFATIAVTTASAGFSPEIAAYFALAALALVVVVELEAFTSVELSRRFAAGFAVLTTMALQALWTIAQFYSDRWLGTDYLQSQTELQWDFVAVTVVGFALGGLFQWYAARFGANETVGRSKTDAGSP